MRKNWNTLLKGEMLTKMFNMTPTLNIIIIIKLINKLTRLNIFSTLQRGEFDFFKIKKEKTN